MAHPHSSGGRTKEIAPTGHDGKPSAFTCPDCQGTLFILKDGSLIRFRCRIGHLYSPESMLEAQAENVERLGWSAVRALEEQGEYIAQMADQVAKAKDHNGAKRYTEMSRFALQKAAKIREIITDDPE